MKIICDKCGATVDYDYSARVEIWFSYQLNEKDSKTTLCKSCALKAKALVRDWMLNNE
jgi:hypothetical protein